MYATPLIWNACGYANPFIFASEVLQTGTIQYPGPLAACIGEAFDALEESDIAKPVKIFISFHLPAVRMSIEQYNLRNIICVESMEYGKSSQATALV